jgi:hypothetical protein
MLGGPLGKLLILIAVVVAVWYGWKYVNRVNQVRAEQRRRATRRSAQAIEAEDMRKCLVCGTYVTGRPGGCGRTDCPY